MKNISYSHDVHNSYLTIVWLIGILIWVPVTTGDRIATDSTSLSYMCSVTCFTWGWATLPLTY